MWDDVVLVVSETVAWVDDWWVVCVGGWVWRVREGVGLVCGVWVGKLGGRGCGFVSAVCQVVEELEEVEEG